MSTIEKVESDKDSLIKLLFSKVCNLNDILKKERCLLSREDRSVIKLNESTTADTESLIVELKEKYEL